MKLRLVCLLSSTLLVASTSALASGPLSGPLTPQECNSYPFVHTQSPVTHKDLMRELALLESMGYNPVGDDAIYPNDIRSAEKRLNAKYLADCHPALSAAQTAVQTPSSVQ